MRRNLFLFSCLHGSNIYYHFGDTKCTVKCNNIDVGLVIRQDKLYLLSNYDHINEIKASFL
jgi:hypothetical protein